MIFWFKKKKPKEGDVPPPLPLGDPEVSTALMPQQKRADTDPASPTNTVTPMKSQRSGNVTKKDGISAPVLLLVPLQNPGARYENTRHNVGAWFVNRWYAHRGLVPKKSEKRLHGILGSAGITEKEVRVYWPETYMNLCGKGIASVCAFFRIPLQSILVIHDDMDLGLGRLRFRAKGSSGGHNGIKSIIDHFGNNTQFSRLKIGISADTNHRGANFVLGKWSPDEEKVLETLYPIVEHALDLCITNGTDHAMEYVHGLRLSSSV